MKCGNQATEVKVVTMKLEFVIQAGERRRIVISLPKTPELL